MYLEMMTIKALEAYYLHCQKSQHKHCAQTEMASYDML